MKTIKKVFIVIIICVLGCVPYTSYAQTMAYKYSHSVKDGVKVRGPYTNNIWYLTFTSDKSKFYITDANGVATTSNPSGIYMGTENGILVYKGVIPFLGTDYYYFSSDFKRLNWNSIVDNMNNSGPRMIRVLNYVANPNTSTAPPQLY